MSSTVDNNAGGAEGIALDGDSANVQEATISGNGGGAFSADSNPKNISILDSTLTQNNSGLWISSTNPSTHVTIVSSILADNGCDFSNHCDLYSSVTLSSSSDYNLIMSTNLTTLPPHTVTAEPRLAPLAYHGGPTRTHALLPDSPAIWAGNPATPFMYDQRGPGFPRAIQFFTPHVDIGAYQRQIIDDEIFAHGFGLTPSD